MVIRVHIPHDDVVVKAPNEVSEYVEAVEI